MTSWGRVYYTNLLSVLPVTLLGALFREDKATAPPFRVLGNRNPNTHMREAGAGYVPANAACFHAADSARVSVELIRYHGARSLVRLRYLRPPGPALTLLRTQATALCRLCFALLLWSIPCARHKQCGPLLAARRRWHVIFGFSVAQPGVRHLIHGGWHYVQDCHRRDQLPYLGEPRLRGRPLCAQHLPWRGHHVSAVTAPRAAAGALSGVGVRFIPRRFCELPGRVTKVLAVTLSCSTSTRWCFRDCGLLAGSSLWSLGSSSAAVPEVRDEAAGGRQRRRKK